LGSCLRDHHLLSYASSSPSTSSFLILWFFFPLPNIHPWYTAGCKKNCNWSWKNYITNHKTTFEWVKNFIWWIEQLSKGFPQSPVLFAKLSAGILLCVKTGTGPDNRLLVTVKTFIRSSWPICGGIWPARLLLSSFRSFKKDKLAIPDGISPEKLLKDRSRIVMYGSLLEMLDALKLIMWKVQTT